MLAPSLTLRVNTCTSWTVKHVTKSLSISSPNIDRFKNSLTVELCEKTAIARLLNISPHLCRYTTLWNVRPTNNANAGYIVSQWRYLYVISVINSRSPGSSRAVCQRTFCSLQPGWLQLTQHTGCVVVTSVVNQPISGAVISAGQARAGGAVCIGRRDSRSRKLSCRSVTSSTSRLHHAAGSHYSTWIIIIIIIITSYGELSKEHKC